jgi:hypothetical protein
MCSCFAVVTNNLLVVTLPELLVAGVLTDAGNFLNVVTALVSLDLV